MADVNPHPTHGELMNPGDSDSPVPPLTHGLYLATEAEVQAADDDATRAGTEYVSGAATALGTGWEKIGMDAAIMGPITGPKVAGVAPKVRPLTLMVKVSADVLMSCGPRDDRDTEPTDATHGTVTITSGDGWFAIPVQFDKLKTSSNVWLKASAGSTTMQHYWLGV